jgi:4-amino-4-deoxy-L-arabinose transferase-like glycosyltransferase
MLFAFVFAGCIAMLRGGPSGIWQAYTRYRLEYISDIGLGGSIRGLFREYTAKHAMLSIHAKVHPPGPIVILWVLSYVVMSRGPAALALGTMALGAASLAPLYFLAKEMTSRRVALTTCALMSLAPSFVLFTATSADVTFLPFVFLTLLLFWRAMHRDSWGYALAAGASYGVLSVISFSLAGLGAFFGIVGLWRMMDPDRRAAVVRTAMVMILGAVLFHVALWLWSGFDVFTCFSQSKTQFDTDQHSLEQLAPRFPTWAWKFFNPLCWVFFAGIPVSILAWRRLVAPGQAGRTLAILCGLTLVALDMLYLARGEGERSAMYVLPFFVLPAAHYLDEIGSRLKSLGPLAATLCFLAFQCWLVETYFYTWW